MTEVEVRFSPEGAKQTRVDFEHRNLERYGEAAAGIRGQLDDPKGWHGNLDRFAHAAGLKAVASYEATPNVLELARLHFPAHKARLDQFAGRGDLLAVGPFADPRDGSLAIFANRDAAEEFVREDPFVLHGVVTRATIKDWNEILLG